MYDDFQEVLGRLKELTDLFLVKIRKAEDAKASADKLAVEASQLKATCDGRVQQLTRREQAVAAREHDADTRLTLDTLAKQTHGERDALKAAQATFAAEQLTAGTTLRDGLDNLKIRQAKLTKAELDLDHERKVYKDKIRKELVSAGWTPPSDR